MSKTIGALWKPQKKAENSPSLIGSIELIAGMPVKVAVFPNTKKTKPNQPDFNIVLSQMAEEKKESTVAKDEF
jgi:uncharacterized protein (DUF736 family)